MLFSCFVMSCKPPRVSIGQMGSVQIKINQTNQSINQYPLELIWTKPSLSSSRNRVGEGEGEENEVQKNIGVARKILLFPHLPDTISNGSSFPVERLQRSALLFSNDMQKPLFYLSQDGISDSWISWLISFKCITFLKQCIFRKNPIVAKLIYNSGPP